MTEEMRGAPLEVDDRLLRVARTLHIIRGRGYCSEGRHERHMTFICYDEARAILAALDAVEPPPEARPRPKHVTLSAREEAPRGRDRTKP